MKKAILLFSLLVFSFCSFSQTKKIELFDLVKKLVQDSTLYSSAGDWAVGKSNTYPVKWKADKIEMSDDLTINFFREGSADILVNNKSITPENKTDKWAVLLKGARSGFSSFTITSPTSKDIKPKLVIDSLLGTKNISYKILQTCNKKDVAGFTYYKVNSTKKVTAWIKLSYRCKNDACVLTLDCYDDWSKQYANLVCPN
jgi:hypothetical protein